MTSEPSLPPAPVAAPPPSRRERGRLSRREALLSAAERIFSRKGFDGATVAEIARAAAVSVGTVYNAFPGKRELAEAVMERAAEERVSAVRERALPLAADPARGLPEFVRVRLEQHLLHGAFFRMGFEAQLARGRREPPEAIRALFAEGRAAGEAFFAVGRASGRYPDLPPDALFRSFDGMCREWIFSWERGGRPVSPEAFAESLSRAVVALFLR